ncbi:MAG: leucyl aminopeptidase family protein [Propionicimonas sp.]
MSTFQAPSLSRPVTLTITAAAPAEITLGRFLQPQGLASLDQLDPVALLSHGFDAEPGSVVSLWSGRGRATVLGGIGETPALADVRDAAAAIARASSQEARLAIELPSLAGSALDQLAEVIVEGALLARYSYDALRQDASRTPITELTIVAPAGVDEDAVRSGAERGRILAAATALTRDLVNAPHNHLTASRFAEFADRFGAEMGLQVEVFGMDEIRSLRLGGLLGVNAGSAEPARMVRLTYRPVGEPTARIALVGKGIMYDAGGISLKPSDGVHAQMKNDMAGAAAILASMAALGELGCSAEVTGYLMCTDNMPSGSATALGDVLTMRNGTTVEVIDTDAEGRLVMADALVLACEAKPDAIFDIATLTGSASRALGPDVAAVLGNQQAVIDRAIQAGAAAGEPLWQLPLHRPYLRMLESETADIANCAAVGLPDAILAALFLDTFVDGIPWAHIDVAGTAMASSARSVLVPGGSGFGARLLAHLLVNFSN